MSPIVVTHTHTHVDDDHNTLVAFVVCHRSQQDMNYLHHCLLLVAIDGVFGQNWLQDHLFPPDYDLTEPPIIDGRSIPVNLTFVVHNFAEDETRMTLTTDLTFCIIWHDHRLSPLASMPWQGTNITRRYTKVKFTQIDRFWRPRVVFRNGLSVRELNNVHNAKYIEYTAPSRRLEYCRRLEVEFVCYFPVQNFPFDEHYCNFEVQAIQNMNYLTVNLHVEDVAAPLDNRDMATNQRFRVRRAYIERCGYSEIDIFQVSQDMNVRRGCAIAGVYLIRRVDYYIIRYYCPTFLLMAICVLTIWLPVNAYPSRVILVTGCTLTMINISISGYNEVPAEYMTSLYWWLWGMQMFMYYSIVDLGVACAWMYFILDKKAAKKAGVPSIDGYYFGKNGWYRKGGKIIQRLLHFVYGPLDFYDDPFGRNKWDYFSRLLVLTMLFIFLVSYILATLPFWSERFRYDRGIEGGVRQ